MKIQNLPQNTHADFSNNAVVDVTFASTSYASMYILNTQHCNENANFKTAKWKH